MMSKLVVHSSSDSRFSEDSKLVQLKADMVVHGAGRVPNIEGT